jgi:hypothetical protein
MIGPYRVNVQKLFETKKYFKKILHWKPMRYGYSFL